MKIIKTLTIEPLLHMIVVLVLMVFGSLLIAPLFGIACIADAWGIGWILLYIPYIGFLDWLGEGLRP